MQRLVYADLGPLSQCHHGVVNMPAIDDNPVQYSQVLTQLSNKGVTQVSKEKYCAG